MSNIEDGYCFPTPTAKEKAQKVADRLFADGRCKDFAAALILEEFQLSSVTAVSKVRIYEEALGMIAKICKSNRHRDPISDILCECNRAKRLLVESPASHQIVCICGSSRFVSELDIHRRRLMSLGYIVLSMERFEGLDDSSLRQLQELHYRQIDLAHEVFVLNVAGYIGESTRREIDYAHKGKKPVHYLETPL